MNWALLLSKYPRSILSEERPLLVLAILERAGLATEAELEKMARSRSAELKTTLLQLQLNELIEYGTNHVRLTEAGKEVLERLALHDEILDDVLDTLAVTGTERRDYRRAIETYRKTSFHLYQNSLCSIRQWRSLSEDMPGGGESETYRMESRAGMRSLLLRDLRNWCSHSSIGSSLISEMKSSFRSAIWFDDVSSHSLSRSSTDIHKATLFFLYALLDEKRSTEYRVTADQPSSLAALFYDFHHFQASSEPDVWFDKWVVEFKPPDRKRYRNSARYVVRLRDAVRRLHTESMDSHSTDNKLWLYLDAWRPSSSSFPVTDTLVADLLVSKGVSELAERTGIPENSLRLLLDEIRGAANRLLEVESPKSELADGSLIRRGSATDENDVHRND